MSLIHQQFEALWRVEGRGPGPLSILMLPLKSNPPCPPPRILKDVRGHFHYMPPLTAALEMARERRCKTRLMTGWAGRHMTSLFQVICGQAGLNFFLRSTKALEVF